MKIADGLKLPPDKHGRIIIPDCSRDDLPAFFKGKRYRVGLEIGVYYGEFTEKFCKVGLKMYGVDPYCHYRRYRRHPLENTYDIIRESAEKRLAPYDFTLIQKLSEEALDDFPDGSLDFVYIDGNHRLPYVVQDVYEWHRKVKVGGVLCGHDYGLMARQPYSYQACHVKFAVDICARLFGQQLCLLGEKHPKEGEQRDKWRSWLWIKE